MPRYLISYKTARQIHKAESMCDVFKVQQFPSHGENGEKDRDKKKKSNHLGL
jgi:hypothetical protein